MKTWTPIEMVPGCQLDWIAFIFLRDFTPCQTKLRNEIKQQDRDLSFRTHRETCNRFLTWFWLRSTISALAASARPLFRQTMWTAPPEDSKTNHISVQASSNFNYLNDLTSLCNPCQKRAVLMRCQPVNQRLVGKLQLVFYKIKTKDSRNVRQLEKTAHKKYE